MKKKRWKNIITNTGEDNTIKPLHTFLLNTDMTVSQLKLLYGWLGVDETHHYYFHYFAFWNTNTNRQHSLCFTSEWQLKEMGSTSVTETIWQKLLCLIHKPSSWICWAGWLYDTWILNKSCASFDNILKKGEGIDDKFCRVLARQKKWMIRPTGVWTSFTEI